MSRPPSDQPHEPAPGEPTAIIRRSPTGPIPPPADDNRTGIIRRSPTGPVPTPTDDGRTAIIRRGCATPGQATPRPDPDTTKIAGQDVSDQDGGHPSAASAVAACVIAMLSGWPTSVVATDLIVGWWDTDRLFCVAVGFLALVFAASTISGVVLLLLRRPAGRFLLTVGAVVALLAFAGVFIAGAAIPWIVYVMPVLPVASAVLALLPQTRRWSRPARTG